jgi:hypothetical protein
MCLSCASDSGLTTGLGVANMLTVGVGSLGLCSSLPHKSIYFPSSTSVDGAANSAVETLTDLSFAAWLFMIGCRKLMVCQGSSCTARWQREAAFTCAPLPQGTDTSNLAPGTGVLFSRAGRVCSPHSPLIPCPSL